MDPIAFSIGPFSVRWYALAYMAGLLLGWRIIIALARRDLPPEYARACEDILIWLTLGVILGGRLGYVLFYNLPHYLDHPVEIFKVWQGGMSFHGGMIGVILALIGFSRRNHLAVASVFDLASVAAPVGIFFGRIANFINGELYGRVTDVPWAMTFDRGGDLLRHPSQLYEALGEGIMLFIILFAAVRLTHALSFPWRLSGIFLVGYAVARIIVELFREPDAHLGLFWAQSLPGGITMGGITMGQILSLPMLILGIAFILFSTRRSPSRSP